MRDAITDSVARLYEMFPYPRYPLLAKPRWQDGYLASSLFAARLREAGDRRLAAPAGRREAVSILLGGSGEILPYVVRKWEPWSNHVLSLDLSRASLLRARWRLGPLAPRSSFVQGDLADWLGARGATAPRSSPVPVPMPMPGPSIAARNTASAAPEQSTNLQIGHEHEHERAHGKTRSAPPFDHIDAYGVLHHMPNPGHALALLAANLAPGGTIRLMVYNSPARAWIHELQALLRLLRVSAFDAEDRAFARRFVNALGRSLPPLGERLAQMGSEMLRSEARFVDAFLHTREARLGLGRWRELIEGAGLEAYALFDRYGELDDLANPLWKMPDWEALAARAADGRFENNLELFLAKADDARPPAAAGTHPRRLLLKPPPRAWFSYRETEGVDLTTRWRIWHAFVRGTPVDQLTGRLTRPALQRLSRLGAIVPRQLVGKAERAVAAAALSPTMELPERPEATEREKNIAMVALEAALKERGLDCDERARRAAAARIRRLGAAPAGWREPRA